jgi:hypothetical protein
MKFPTGTAATEDAAPLNDEGHGIALRGRSVAFDRQGAYWPASPLG